jgi:hypothetical protein
MRIARPHPIPLPRGEGETCSRFQIDECVRTNPAVGVSRKAGAEARLRRLVRISLRHSAESLNLLRWRPPRPTNQPNAYVAPPELRPRCKRECRPQAPPRLCFCMSLDPPNRPQTFPSEHHTLVRTVPRRNRINKNTRLTVISASSWPVKMTMNAAYGLKIQS